MTITQLLSGLKDKVRKAYPTDATITKLLEEVQEGMNGILKKVYKNAVTKNGLLYLGDRLWIPQEGQLQILQECHDTPLSGHFGFDKTYNSIAQHFYWPKMTADIKKFIASYIICQKYK